MKTDIEIAQETKMLPITTVASQYGITEDDLELYGKYKAKISNELWQEIKDRPDGKLVLVTAINPTPAGEGKTTTSVGLGQAFGKLGKKAVIALREPSLGPCFGIKGGAAGGGYAVQFPLWCHNALRRSASPPSRCRSCTPDASPRTRRRDRRWLSRSVPPAHRSPSLPANWAGR